MVKEITDATFKSEITEAKGYTLIDFWGEGCGPCIQLAPILEEVSKDMANKVNVCKMNIYDNPEVPSQFGIRGIPTLILFKDGKPHATRVGALPKSNLIEWLESEIEK